MITMPNNFFLTGLPKVGKTTLLRQLAAELKRRKIKVGGFLSPEIQERGTREGFYTQDIATGKKALLAEVGAGGPRVGKYRVDVKEFESVALPCLKNCRRYDVLILDEIGRMELESEKFGDLLADVLQTDIPVIASLHGRYLQTYSGYGTVYGLTEANRGAIYVRLVDRFKGMKKRKKAKKRAQPAKRAAKKKAKPAKNKAEAGRKKGKRARKKAALKKKPVGKPRKRGILHHIKRWLRRK